MAQIQREISELLAWLEANPQPKATADERYQVMKDLIAKRNQLTLLKQTVNN